MKKQRLLKSFLVFFLITLISGFMGVNVTQAIPYEQTGWDVVYNSSDPNHPGDIYSGATASGQMSLATNSNGYPGVAFCEAYNTTADTTGLAYTDCPTGDCAYDSGGGSENWSTYQKVDTFAVRDYNIRCMQPSMDFDTSNAPTVVYEKNNSQLWLAKYTPGTGSGCVNGVNGNQDWTCSQLGSSLNYGSSDIVIDSNNNHYVAYANSSQDVWFTMCDGTTYDCDLAGQYVTPYLVHNGTGNIWGISMDIDSSGILHLSFADQSGNNLKYTSCDTINATNNCTQASDWPTTPDIVATNLTYPVDTSLDASTSVLGIAFKGVNHYLKYAEYVGSGGNCDTVYSGGSDAWNCTDVSTTDWTVAYNGTQASTLSMDIYGPTGQRGISFQDNSTFDLHYAHCTSNCTTENGWEPAGGGGVDNVFVDDGNTTETGPGMLTSIEFGSGPRIAFGERVSNFSNVYQYIYYAEQESDLPPEESIVPELPQNYLWKIAIAVLAFGLVVGIVAWRNKNKD